MSKVDRLLMGCIYLILGIPLIYVSTKTPEVEDISKLKLNEDSMNTLLNYPQHAVIAADIGYFQQFLCWISAPGDARACNKWHTYSTFSL